MYSLIGIASVAGFGVIFVMGFSNYLIGKIGFNY
jgi:hypothetical protein